MESLIQEFHKEEEVSKGNIKKRKKKKDEKANQKATIMEGRGSNLDTLVRQ